MPDVTYTIYNNSTNTTATINYFEIQSDVSKLQHRLKIPVTWNSPFNSSPYTNLTSSTTLTIRAKDYLDHISNINYETTAVTTGTVLNLESNSFIELGWSVFNQDYIYGTQTVVNLIGTQTVVMSSAPDVVPFGSGETITFIPPEYYLDLNNTTDLQPGWAAFGNGYNGETILTVTSSTRVIMSDQPATTPSTGSIVFKSLNDVMIQIPPMSNNTFNMDYDRITSVVGSYRSTVTMYAILGTLVSKIVNNYMTVSAPAPVPEPPPSPFYEPAPVPPAPPPVVDTGSSTVTGSPPPAPAPAPTSTSEGPGGGGLTTDTTIFDDGSTLSITKDDSGQVVSITSTPSTDGTGGSGDTKVICTELYMQGYLEKRIYLVDQVFGRDLLKKDPVTYWGYRKWADILVNYMRGQGSLKLLFWLSEDKKHQVSKKIAIGLAKSLGIPFAYELARRKGKVKTFNLLGYLLVSIGLKICHVIGRFIKKNH